MLRSARHGPANHGLFSGAPVAAFTVYGVTPQRDAAVIGFSARTAVSDNASVYLR